MAEHVLIGLAGITVLGIGAQWLAWRFKFPSILFLLILGFVAGPVTGFLDPNELFGDLLLPVVSLSVAIILFEGGLNLRISELREIGKVVRNLVTVGILVTWILIAFFAYFILQLHLQMSVLLGAILVVTGPTVILPLLRHVRPAGRLSNIIKWEGIVNDPVGAVLGVLVFEAILGGTISEAGGVFFWGIVKTIFLGSLIGVVGAGIMVVVLRRYWVPDFLQESVMLMLVVIVFVLSNKLQAESGLFSVTLMGIVLANQKKIAIQQILQFKENLRVLIISSLFILLAARLKLEVLNQINLNSLLFVAALLLLVRPLIGLLSTMRSALNWRERVFISWMAPRGIVAASVSSIFALRLAETGFPQTEYLVPITFLVIVVTVAVYGLTASPIARWLGVANTNPQGALIIGAHVWAREIASTLQAEGFKVILVDTNRFNEYHARMQGLPTYHGSILSENIMNEIDLVGIGRLLALTPNDEANSLAALHFAELFDSSEVYQLVPETATEDEEFSPQYLRGRFLFGKGLDFLYLSKRFADGGIMKKTRLSEDFDYEDFQKQYGETAVPMFLITEQKTLRVFSADAKLEPEAGQTIIALVNPAEERNK